MHQRSYRVLAGPSRAWPGPGADKRVGPCVDPSEDCTGASLFLNYFFFYEIKQN